MKLKTNDGPWKVISKKEPMYPRTYEIKDVKGMHLADVNIGMSNAKGNAFLMGAALELLEVLTEVNNRYRTLMTDKMQERIAQALRKATHDETD